MDWMQFRVQKIKRGTPHDPQPDSIEGRDDWRAWMGLCASSGPDVLAVPVELRRCGVWLRRRGRKLVVGNEQLQIAYTPGEMDDDGRKGLALGVFALAAKLCGLKTTPKAAFQAGFALSALAELDEAYAIGGATEAYARAAKLFGLKPTMYEACAMGGLPEAEAA